MENKIAEYEKKQMETANNSLKIRTKLENSYKEADTLIGEIKKKQRELESVRIKLWTTVIVMIFIVAGSYILRTYY